MAEQFDIVIAGAGHNSLITAAYLGKAGFSCLVLEARPVIGGNTMTEELTLPGFLHDHAFPVTANLKKESTPCRCEQ